MPRETKRRQSTAGKNASEAAHAPHDRSRTTTKLARIIDLVARPEGASLAELVSATGWQPHSVRGALAGSLKKKGHEIRSEKIDGERRYRLAAAE